MKRIIKSIIGLFVCFVLVLSIFSFNVSAANGGLSIGVSGALNPGKTITVSVTVSAPSGISFFGVFEATAEYDTSYLKMISTSDGVTSAAGVIPICNTKGGAGTKSLTTTITFNVLKAGSTKINIRDIIVDGFEVSNGSKTLSIVAPTKSSDNTLKSLKVGAGKLTPAFSPNVTEYSVTVPYSVDYFNIDAVKNHSGASISYSSGDKGPAIKVGKTVRTVTVTAENGSVKKYNVTVTRLAQDATSSETSSNLSSETVSTPEDTTLNVSVNGKDMLIKEDVTGIETPVGLELGEYEYKGINVPAFMNKDKSLIVLYLLGEENSGFYIYKPETDTFEALNTLNSNGKFILLPVTFINSDEFPFDIENTFNLSVATINGIEIPAYVYKNENLSDFVVICAQNSKGEIGYYTYDIKEGTLQRYISQSVIFVDGEHDKNALAFLTEDVDTIVVLSCFVLTILVIIAIIVVWAVRRKKNNSQDLETDEQDESDFDWVNEVIVGDDFSDSVDTKEEQEAKLDFEEFFTQPKNEISNDEID